MKQYCTYILTNKNKTVLYTGVTSNLESRMYQHKNKLIDGFSAKYNVNELLYYELFENIEPAILREKQIKKWKRSKKVNLIEIDNPQWNDLCVMLFGF